MNTLYAILFLTLPFVVAVALTVKPHDWLVWCYTFFSYYIILALSAGWVLSLGHMLQPVGTVFGRRLARHAPALGGCLLVTALIFASTPCYFRVLSDETNLLSVAKSMTFSRTTEMVTEGVWNYEMYWPSKTTIGKRPLLFPFVVSVAHTFVGYQPANAFGVNFLVLWLTLFLIHHLLRPALGSRWAFAAVILFVAQPVVALSATSASFELLNLLFILVSLLALQRFLDAPDNGRLAFLAMSLLMLANIRYESGVFLAVTAAGLFIQRKLPADMLKPVLAYALMPLGLLALVWQRVLQMRIPASDMPRGSLVAAFSFAHLRPNLMSFIQHAFACDGESGFAGLVNWIAVVFLVLLLYDTVIGRRFASLRPGHTIFLYIGACLLAFLLVILTYFQAGMTVHPLNGRMYLPVILVLSLAAAAVLARLSRRHERWDAALFTGVILLFLYYHPVAVEDRIANKSLGVRNFRYAIAFLREADNKGCCVIVNLPGQYAVYNYGSLSFISANKRLDEIRNKYNKRMFSPLYVVQRIMIATGEPMDVDRLDPAYRLETLRERQGSADYMLRISRVTEMTP